MCACRWWYLIPLWNASARNNGAINQCWFLLPPPKNVQLLTVDTLCQSVLQIKECKAPCTLKKNNLVPIDLFYLVELKMFDFLCDMWHGISQLCYKHDHVCICPSVRLSILWSQRLTSATKVEISTQRNRPASWIPVIPYSIEKNQCGIENVKNFTLMAIIAQASINVRSIYSTLYVLTTLM